jgi:tol-pal system protein YbgF
MMKAAGARLQWGGLGLLMILTLSGCTGDRELAVMRNDLDRMNRQLLQLQVAQEVGRTKPRELVQQEMEGDRRTIADLKAGFDDLKQQVSVLAERMDESGHQLNQRMSTLESKLTAGAPQTLTGSGPSSSSSAQTPAPTASPGPSGQSPGATPPATAPASPEAKRLYQAALGDYQRGKFDLAAQGFRAYLQQAPNGDVADTAQYYLAESLYSAKDYRNAIAEFERLVRDFPQSPQVPGALLKTGYAYYEIKDGTQGRRALRTLIEKYPMSREAKLAEERLRLEERSGSSRPAPGSPSAATSRPPSR